jgi:two-component system, cell cycle sensor histidine kinase and response regulator CckA
MENTPGAAWIKDENNRYVYANQAIESLFDIARSEIISKKDEEFLPAKSAEQLAAQDAATRASGKSKRAEGNLVPGDPRQWFVCRFPFPSPTGEKLVGGLAFDVTDQLQLQRSLHASEERFRTLFEASPVGIGLVYERHLLFTNFSYRQLFDLPPEAATADRPFLENIAPATRDELNRYFAAADSVAASLAAIETRGLRSDGSEFPCLVQIAPVELQEGRAHLVFVIDISEKRALEAQLFQSQKMESIGRLAGGIAHDFANLLTVIQGHAARIERGTSNPAASIDGIMRASHKATELTKQLLAFSRKQTLQIAEIDLNSVIAQTGRMIERVVGENIALRLHLAPGLPQIHADHMLLEQLVLNLAVTGRDAMRAGGNLTISTYYVPPKPGALATGWDKGSVCLRVEDTGRGISKEDLPHIFEPFFKTSVGSAVALRLATAYGIVKQHNGNIEVSSELGSGTVFDILFPSAALPPTAAESGSARAQKTGTILIVEDANDLRMMLRDLLIDFGYSVREAPSYSEAVNVFSKHRQEITLVIADVFLADGSGRDLVRQFRTEDPRLRAIITTGYDPHQMREKMDLQSNELFLAKPFQTDELITAIETLLRAKSVGK